MAHIFPDSIPYKQHFIFGHGYQKLLMLCQVSFQKQPPENWSYTALGDHHGGEQMQR